MRAQERRTFVSPQREYVPSVRNFSSFTCSGWPISPIESRYTMPFSAFSTSPGRVRCDGDCDPKRAASMSESRIVEQSRISSGRLRHIFALAIARMAKSLPVPTSPRISTCADPLPAAEMSS